jgi:hypothetical protein
MIELCCVNICAFVLCWGVVSKLLIEVDDRTMLRKHLCVDICASVLCRGCCVE